MAGDRVLNLTDGYCGPRQSSMRMPRNISWQYKLFPDPFYVNIVRQAIRYDRYEVHEAVIIKSAVVWALKPCSSETDMYQICLLLRLVSVWFMTLDMEAKYSSETQESLELHSFKPQKTTLFNPQASNTPAGTKYRRQNSTLCNLFPIHNR
jgi:hypothetical protein